MGTEDAIVFTTGHQANVGTLGTILGPGDTVVADSGDHASILDGCLLSRAKLRAFRHNRMDKLERMLERAANDGGGVLVVVDGVFSMEGDVAAAARDLRPVRALRRAADGRRGPRRRRARRARRRGGRALRRRGPRRPAHGHVLEVAGQLRRLHRRPGRRHRVPAHPEPRLPLHRLVGAGRRRRRPGRAADRPHATRAASSWPGSSPTRATGATASWSAASRSSRHGDLVTPIVPVLVEDDWKAGLLWKALYDAGVFVNTALHPAVPPGGALLRTSVMATHDTRHARPRARRLRLRQGVLRGRARAAPGPRRRLIAAASYAAAGLSNSSQVGAAKKKDALCESWTDIRVDRSATSWRSFHALSARRRGERASDRVRDGIGRSGPAGREPHARAPLPLRCTRMFKPRSRFPLREGSREDL